MQSIQGVYLPATVNITKLFSDLFSVPFSIIFHTELFFLTAGRNRADILKDKQLWA